MTSLVSSSAMIIDMDMDMDMVMDGVLDFSEYSTTTPNTSDDDAANYDWNHWSPVVNWESFTAGHDDFHGLIDSIMEDGTATDAILIPHHPGVEEESTGDGCNSDSTTTEEEEEEDEVSDDLKGLRLVHLLMAAAEALTGATKSRDLARVILVRLKELVSPTHSTNMERLAAYFTHALQGLLEGVGCAHGTTKHQRYVISGPHCEDHLQQTDMLAAFQLLQDMSPCIKFAHFTANQAILEAVAHERRVHIVDYDIMEGAQWASLMQAFSSSTNGPHLRITALSRGSAVGRRSIATVQETGRRLTTFAASLGQPFSFHQCRLDPDETFRASSLKLVRGEALVFNCMLHLPHLNYRDPDSVASFLSGAKSLSPRLVTLVEEEIGPVGGETGFVGRFMDSLHHYSAVYDSIEAGFPMQRQARALVERVFLGPQIAGSLARIYRTGEEGEERGSWGEWLDAAGLRGVLISCANRCQAKLLIGLFNDGYRVEELGNSKLVLCWKSRRLLSASIWTSTTH